VDSKLASRERNIYAAMGIKMAFSRCKACSLVMTMKELA
jgi:hypothetical protein